jgi:hypothetical protein
VPMILVFPASAKPFKQGLAARIIEDPSPNINDLANILYTDGSFGKENLRLATTEQLGTLLGDEELVRAGLEEEERASLRAHLRKVYTNGFMDFWAGDVVFDGHRWHLALVLLSLLGNAGLLLALLLYMEGKQKAASRTAASGKGQGGYKSD